MASLQVQLDNLANKHEGELAAASARAEKQNGEVELLQTKLSGLEERLVAAGEKEKEAAAAAQAELDAARETLASREAELASAKQEAEAAAAFSKQVFGDR